MYKAIDKEYLEQTFEDYDEEVIEPVRQYVTKATWPTIPGNYILSVKPDGSMVWQLAN